MRKLSVLVLLLFCSCATQSQFKKGDTYSQMSTSGYSTDLYQVDMDLGSYSLESVLPLMREISPQGYEDARTAYQIKAVTAPVRILGLIAIAAGLFVPNSNHTALVAGGSGLVLGTMAVDWYGRSRLEQGMTQFNYDLKEGFNPKVSFRFNF